MNTLINYSAQEPHIQQWQLDDNLKPKGTVNHDYDFFIHRKSINFPDDILINVYVRHFIIDANGKSVFNGSFIYPYTVILEPEQKIEYRFLETLLLKSINLYRKYYFQRMPTNISSDYKVEIPLENEYKSLINETLGKWNNNSH